MRVLLLTVILGAGCLGQYNAPPDPRPAPPQKTQPSPSGPSQSPSPSPSPSPAPPQTPPPNDLATAPPAPTSDGGTSTACAQLVSCCDQDQTCLDQVAGLDEAVCQGILDQLQQQGYCL
ncbi:MAG: hypothetical protein ACXVDD_18740 [Polyangia bacterium]